MDGWPALSIHGDKSQQERDWVLSEFKQNKSPIMLATDVAARGLGMPKRPQSLLFLSWPCSLFLTCYMCWLVVCCVLYMSSCGKHDTQPLQVCVLHCQHAACLALLAASLLIPGISASCVSYAGACGAPDL